jgi:dipicolinate synthase subunit A
MKDFVFSGGDLRFIYAAAKLNKEYSCSLFGFDTLHEDVKKEINVPILQEPEKHKNVILPLPMSRKCSASRDELYITAPYFSGNMSINSVLSSVEKGGTVYCGKACPVLHEICGENGLRLVDYFEREELIVKNAAITAEGAIEIIMREKARAMMGMDILVTGYGRIAKVLSGYLRALGANVTVCARKFADLAWARIMGCSAVHIDDIDPLLSDFDTIVNTIPASVFNCERLSKCKNDCLLLDLASKPCTDCMSSGVMVIWALSIPGKVAPITAGEIIADTILNIITENGGENSA